MEARDRHKRCNQWDRKERGKENSVGGRGTQSDGRGGQLIEGDVLHGEGRERLLPRGILVWEPLERLDELRVVTVAWGETARGRQGGAG